MRLFLLGLAALCATALLTTAGTADVKWNGTHLTVLVYSLTPRLYQYTYDSDLRTWNLRSGFPIVLPAPPGTETMILEQDSSGRYWMVTESNGQILAYYTNDDASNWNPTPVVLQTSVNVDDICSMVDLGDGRTGVFWSDQNRDEFGFRIHNDTDDPRQGQPMEIALEGVGIADDHINLAVDASHRVYAITKVRIEIFDVRGRRIRQLLSEERSAGEHAIVWRGRDENGARVASGAYFALLRAGEIRERIKLVVLK